jgi:cob(I)alamin adenosyltransferase
MLGLRGQGVFFFAGTTAATFARALVNSRSSRALATVGGVQDPFLDNSGGSKRVKSSLYTKTGDKGASSLYNGERRSKTDRVFEALGHQDELNCVLGIAREHCAASHNGLEGYLVEIQSRLFDLGAAVATPKANSSEEKKKYTAFDPRFTSEVESWIDALDATLPPLTNFVIPSGGLSCTHLNLARAICRRAERAVVPLVQAEEVDAEAARYLNRLSDFLFCAGRVASMREKRTETLWRKAASS